MLYTPGQLRDAVGLSKEAFRHWKGVIPALSTARGHAPSFTLGDVLASAVLRHLTDACGVRIGHLAAVAPAIFEVCNAAPLEAIEDQLLAIELGSQRCVAVGDAKSIPLTELTIVCPMSSVVRQFREQLLNPPTRKGSNKSALRTGSNERRLAQ
ncbi:MAG: hypothetical protein AB7O98_19480 [Hyphomonadaceae bacterium]